jgi:hypothetical protein
VRRRLPTGATRNASPAATTTTRFAAVSVERIPTCGALRGGKDIHVPAAPAFVIVPPGQVIAAHQLLGPGPAGHVTDRAGRGAKRKSVGIPHHRHDEPLAVAFSAGYSRSASITDRATTAAR